MQFSQPNQVSQPNLNLNPPSKLVNLKHLYCQGTGIDKHRLPQFGETCKTCGGTGWFQLKLRILNVWLNVTILQRLWGSL